MTVIKKVRSIVSLIYRVLLSILPTRRTQSYDLVIVRCDLLGDFIMKYDSLLEIQKFYQGKRVLLVCPTIVVPFVDKDPFYTRVIGYEMKKMDSISYIKVLAKELKRIKSSTIFYCAWERYPQGDTIVSFIKSKNRNAMRGSHEGGLVKFFYDSQYSNLVDFSKRGSEIIALETFVRETYNPNYKYGGNPLVLSEPLPFTIKSPYIVISISSSMEEKSWPVKHFADLIDLIPMHFTVVLSGAGKIDEEKAEFLLEHCATKSRIVNMVNGTNVLELAGLISKCKLLIGNDSAAVHMAAAQRVQSLCILHGAHYGRFLPYPNDALPMQYLPRVVCFPMDCFYCEYKCIFENRIPFKCLANVSVKKVSEAMLDMLHTNESEG